MDPAIILFGFGVGFLVGLTGMGGGSIMTPLLVLLFGVHATDFRVYVGVSVLLAAVALIAVAIPSARAARVDPLTALRT
jgi:uncharacterized membrane protein YfcA